MFTALGHFIYSDAADVTLAAAHLISWHAIFLVVQSLEAPSCHLKCKLHTDHAAFASPISLLVFLQCPFQLESAYMGCQMGCICLKCTITEREMNAAPMLSTMVDLARLWYLLGCTCQGDSMPW